MPGLMACRVEFGPAQPFKGALITGFLHTIIQTAVLFEALSLGTEVRSCSCYIFSTQDHAAAIAHVRQDNAAAIARLRAAMVARKRERLQEYWWRTEKALDWGPGGGPDLIVDDGRDATLLIHEGVKAEEEFAKTGKVPDPESTTNLEFQIVLGLIKESIKVDPLRYHKMKDRLVGVSEETTTGVKRLYQMQASGTLLFPAINVNDSVTKSKWDDYNGFAFRLSPPVKYVMIADKVGVGCGYGDVGKPFCAVKPVMEALSEDVFGTADIFVCQHMSKMKNNAIACNIGHFDNNFYMQGFEFKPQTDGWVFPDTNSGIIAANLAEGRLMNLGCATDHPSFVMSCSFTKQVIAQLELSNDKKSGKYEEKIYVLPKHLDEKVAALNLPKLGSNLFSL